VGKIMKGKLEDRDGKEKIKKGYGN